ncbi:MAG TPA: ATP-dependent helicase, partial [Ktedonobacteraceae bacterium]|nr:ATP-dependent helicase [Ktedonobacteraceae bacterium]
MVTLDLRGRDLAIIPNEALLHLPTPELLQTLFGVHLPSAVRAAIGRDKRHHFLRTQPIYFSSIKSALRKQHTSFTVAFEE